jgi:hypothetical protein
MKNSGGTTVHFSSNMDFKSVLLTSYVCPKPSIENAVFYVLAYRKILWLDKFIPVCSFEFQREHQKFQHQR